MDPKQKGSGGDKSYSIDESRFRDARQKLPDNYTARPSQPHEIIIRFHHGGFLVTDPVPDYIQGQLYETENGWDIDEISTLELGKILNTMGCQIYKCLWYMQPGKDLSNGLRPLNTDQDVIRFIQDVKGQSKVDLYVEHLIDNPVHGQEGPNSSEVQVVEVDDSDDPEYRLSGSYLSEGDSDGVEEGQNGEGQGEQHLDSGDDISLDDSDYDEQWDWTSVLPEETVNLSAIQITRGTHGEVFDQGNIGSVQAATISLNPLPTTYDDFEDEDGDSEDFDSPPSSDEDEGGQKKFPKFKLAEDGDIVKFEVGQIFSSVELVRTAVKEYALQAKKNVYFEKNDKMRVVVKCMEGCPFYLRVSKSSQHTYYQIVSLDVAHTCHRTSKNRQAKTRWLARKFMSTLRHTPNMKVKALVEEAKSRWGVVLSRYQCYRAQKKATTYC